jgi:hypothetical protein
MSPEHTGNEANGCICDFETSSVDHGRAVSRRFAASYVHSSLQWFACLPP